MNCQDPFGQRDVHYGNAILRVYIYPEACARQHRLKYRRCELALLTSGISMIALIILINL